MNSRSPRHAAFLALLALPLLASAQDSSSTETQAVDKQLRDFNLSVNRTELGNAPRPYGDHLIQLGPIGLSASADYGFTWVQDLPYQGNKTADVDLQTFSAHALMYLGNIWTFDYSPAWQRYSSRLFRDSFDQNLHVVAADSLGPVTLRFEQAYSRSDEVLLDTGVQTREDTFTTLLSANYPINQLLSLDFEGNQNLRFPQDQPIVKDWTGQVWGSFNLMPTLQLGVGLGSSYINLDPGVNNWTNDYNARLTWSPTRKLQLSGTVGEERRHFQHAGFEPMNSGHYALSLLYMPVEGTEFGATASRALSPTLMRDTLSRNESQELHFRQRVFSSSYLSARYSHVKSDYLTIAALSRGDTSDYYTFAAEIPATRHGTLRLSYSIEKNDSSLAFFQRNTKRIGIDLSFRF